MTMRSLASPRIAWFAPHLPEPATDGCRIYSAGLLKAVGRAGARVTFLGLLPPDAGTSFREALDSEIEWHVLQVPPRSTVPALASGMPLVTARSSPRAVVEAARRLLLGAERFDTIVVDNYAAGWILDAFAEHELDRFRLIYVAHNDETKLASDIAADFRGDPMRRLALHVNAHKIRRLEARLVRRADLLVVLTEEDREAFRRRGPAPSTVIVPPGYAEAYRPERQIDASVERRAIMVGSLRWIAKRMNVAAFLEAADQRFAEAGLKLDIIGDAPDEFRAEWEPRLRATTFRGFVDDLAAEMAAARLGLVVEATGGGFKLKTLDYIFQRVPVAALASSCAGMPRAVKDNFVLADDASGLVDAIIGAIDDLPRLNAMHSAAFAAASSLFDWDVGGRSIVDALRPLAVQAAA